MRELGEETGLAAGNIESLGLLHSSPGVFDEVIHLFLATNLSMQKANPEEYEDIALVRLPLEEAVRMARDGRISDGKTIALLLRVQGSAG